MNSSGRGSFDDPDDRSEQAGGLLAVDTVTVGGVTAQRITHAVGWKWSEHSAPEVGEARCPNAHVGILWSGRLWIEPADGTGFEARSGDLVVILPGHDAWTVGDEPAVLFDIKTLAGR